MKSKPEAVAVAEDVLKYLKYLTIEPGVYIRNEDPKNYCNDINIDKNFTRKLKYCHVCALGACFISHKKINGAKSINGIIAGYEIKRELRSIFGEDLIEIEDAFERAGFGGSEDSIRFGQHFENQDKRLTAIMQNIIDHDGHFIPGVDGKNAKKYPRKLK